MPKTTSARRRVYVTYHAKQGEWRVTEAPVVHAIFDTKGAARRWAVDFCKVEAAHGGKLSLYVKKRDGKIQEERTYPRSSDPRRTRG